MTMSRLLFPVGIGLLAAVVAAQLTNEFHLRILFSIATYFLCAAGMNVLLGYAGQKSLGQAGLFAAGAYPADLLLSEYLPFFLLLGFAEAWLSGMALTLLVVYRPAPADTAAVTPEKGQKSRRCAPRKTKRAFQG